MNKQMKLNEIYSKQPKQTFSNKFAICLLCLRINEGKIKKRNITSVKPKTQNRMFKTRAGQSKMLNGMLLKSANKFNTCILARYNIVIQVNTVIRIRYAL